MKQLEHSMFSYPLGWHNQPPTSEMLVGMKMFSSRLAELAKDEPTLFVCDNGETFIFQKYSPNKE
jgi:hypothetical protein